MNELQELTNKVMQFREKRGWTKGAHISPKNAVIGLMLEATELLEIFEWTKDHQIPKNKRQEFEDELIDVLYWVLVIAHDNKVDLLKAFNNKMKKNKIKYKI